MALSTPRIIGRDLAIVCAGSKTIWDTLKTDFKFNKADATASDSTLEEGTFSTKKLTGVLTGYLGIINNGGTLPAIGDTISDFSVKVGADSVYPSLAAYTNIKVTDVSYDHGKDSGKYSISFESGMLN